MDLTDKNISRRKFVKSTAFVGGTLATSSLMSCAENNSTANSYSSDWHNVSDRDWIGAEYWANPMQDWAINGGRLVCNSVGPTRDIHHLTHSLSKDNGEFNTRVQVGCLDNPLNQGTGSAGFTIAINGPLDEYRNSLIYGQGIDAGLSKEGFIFIGEVQQTLSLPETSITLELSGSDSGELTLSAFDNETLLGSVVSVVNIERLNGNIALTTNYASLHGNPPEMNKHNWPNALENPDLFDKFWFSDWNISGSKIAVNPDHVFGPILFNQFTVSRNVLKMTVQMPPLGADENHQLKLQTRNKTGERVWQDRAETTFDDLAYCGTFRLENWDDAVDTEYRILYGDDILNGIIPCDPVEKEKIKVADISCNHHDAFPNFHFTQNVKNLEPDMLAIVGDQYYENSGGYGNARTHNADKTRNDTTLRYTLLDSMRKWMMHGWTWRHLTKDIPSLCLPDDHDVYQGNIWGEGGMLTGSLDYEKDRTNIYDGSAAGYMMDLPWVSIIHKQQTSHNPDAYDPTPTGEGVSNYYGDYLFGRISFAILADRQHKSGPASIMPTDHPNRKDHIYDMDFDLTTIDDPSLNLLGDKQEEFLEAWTENWENADMKAVISQTIFTAMATTHGPEKAELRADLDTNAWPQNKRDKAVKIMRKAFPVHLAGDQHLPALIQYGMEDFRDGPYAFAAPAVNVGYPRWFFPKIDGENRADGAPYNTGDFKDNFDHNLTVYAVGVSPEEPRENVIEFMQDKMSGIGLATFDKTNQKITFECWPFQADPRDKSKQMAGWPVTVDTLDNFDPKTKYYLPTLTVNGLMRPVFKVINQDTDEVIYTIRRQSNEFQPFTLSEGNYKVEIGDGAVVLQTVSDLIATNSNNETLIVDI
jgi:alkaline phosphatase D